jgi:hypothetical protein
MDESPILPPEYAIDYAKLCSLAPANAIPSLTGFLRERLPVKWHDVYLATASHVPNVIRLQRRTFEYICDSYSGLEALGEVPFDQRIQDRVIGVLGTSAPMRGPRRGSQNSLPDLPEEMSGYNRDRGHFMAHCIGGGLDVNVFSQARHVNRGISEEGKTYRQMEKYCFSNPGTFCFSRPIYADTTSVPRWVEFGLIKTDGSLWIQIFAN